MGRLLHSFSPRKVGALFAIALLLLTSTVSILASDRVLADTPTYGTMSLDDQVKSYIYYYAVANCIEGKTSISNDWVANNTFDSGDDKQIGYYIASDDGVQECRTIVPAALSVWGYANLGEALKDWGYTLSGDSWKNAHPAPNFMSNLKARVYAGSAPSLSPADKYLLYSTTLANACQLSDPTPLSSANPGIKSAVTRSRSGYVALNTVSGTPPKATMVATAYKVGRDGSYSLLANGTIDGSAFQDCHGLAEKANQYSSDFLNWANAHPDEASKYTIAATGGGDDDKTSCAIDGVGWIICPVMNFMAQIVDQAYNLISSLLTVQPLITTGKDPSAKPIYTAWSNMRNIANSAFVIAFLVIIYSQLTGVGISNYGIKRMLPKIIIAAVLVNASFWICAIAVDLSNILGGSLRGLLEANDTTKNLFNDVSGIQDGSGWAGLVSVVLAAGIGTGLALYATLAALLPALIAALLAIVTVFLVLTLRQALIILLIVISPLAFVAFLLPNTEEWYKKWKGLFQTLLLMYPIIAIIFGASATASKIVMASATGPYKIPVQIMGALISIIPLAITPVIMKSAGGVLNRFAGVVNNPNRGPFDRMKKSAEGYRDKRKNIAQTRRLRGESMFGSIPGQELRNSKSRFKRGVGNVIGAPAGLAGRSVTKAQQAKSAEAAKKFAEEKYVATRAADENSDYAKKIAGPTGDESLARAYAVQALKEERVKDMKAERALIDNVKGIDELIKIVADKNASTERKAAALAKIYETGGDQHVQEALDYVGKSRQAAVANGDTAAVKQISEMQEFTGDTLAKRKPAGMSNTDLSAYMDGRYDGGYEEKLLTRIKAGKFGEKEWSGMGFDDLVRSAKAVSDAAGKGNFSQNDFNSLHKSISDALANPNLQTTPEQQRVFDALLHLQPPDAQDRAKIHNIDLVDPTTVRHV